MKIAWVQLNSLPEGNMQQSELFNLIRSKTSFCSEVFLFFTQFPPKEKVEATQRLIADNLSGSIHVLFPVRSQEDNTKESVELLCSIYRSEHKYSSNTVTEIGDETAEGLKLWNNDYAAKLLPVKESFHFYGSENLSSYEGSLFSLHLNTSISTTEIEEKSLLCPEGTDRGFADVELKKALNDSIIAIAFGEKGSSLWIEQERDQLINCITYNGKINLYLCGGKTTRVIPHRSRFLAGNFREIQLDSNSCVIGFYDFTCSTGFATHYKYDSVDYEWEKDNNFACNVSVAGIMDAVIYPTLDKSQIQKGIHAEITNFAERCLKNAPPSVSVIDWEVDNSQANESYLGVLANAFFEEISRRNTGQENCIYFQMCGNDITELKKEECVHSKNFRIFIFQNNIGASRVLPPADLIHSIFETKRIPINTAIILFRVHKRGDIPLPKAKPSFIINGREISVEYDSISFAWLDHLILIFSMFCQKKANPEKQSELFFSISNDNSTKVTQDISPKNEPENNAILDISEKQENIDFNNQANRNSDGAQKGDGRDDR